MPSAIHTHKAGRDYFILESVEAGIELKGTEVKSLRAARASIDEAFARVERDQIWLYNCHIQHYEQGNRWNVDPVRPRRLLLHKQEIHRLSSQTNAKGMVLLPLKIYFTKSYAKVLLGLGKGKNVVDKRETLKKKTHEREMQRALRDSQKR